MRTRAAIVAWMLAIALPAQTVLALDVDRIDWPATMRLSVVGERLRINGVEHSIYAFSSPDGADRIAGHLRRAWRGRMKRVSAPPWDIVSHRDADLLIAVQMRAQADGGTQGYVSFSNLFEVLDRRATRLATDVPLPPATRVHQTIDAHDPGARSRTLVLLSDLSPEQPLDFYRDYFRSQGFVPTAGASLQRGQSGGVMVLNRGATQANVAVAASGGTTVVTIVTVNP